MVIFTYHLLHCSGISVEALLKVAVVVKGIAGLTNGHVEGIDLTVIHVSFRNGVVGKKEDIDNQPHSHEQAHRNVSATPLHERASLRSFHFAKLRKFPI